MLGENEIECPHCGARVYYELTRCPECGTDFYPEEGEEREFKDRPAGQRPDLLLSVRTWCKALVNRLKHALRRGFSKGKPEGKQEDPRFLEIEQEFGLYQFLLNKVGRDRKTAEQLIENERKRTPTASRLKLIKKAIEHRERERR